MDAAERKRMARVLDAISRTLAGADVLEQGDTLDETQAISQLAHEVLRKLGLDDVVKVTSEHGDRLRFSPVN